jgi:hypothetical protein
MAEVTDEIRKLAQEMGLDPQVLADAIEAPAPPLAPGERIRVGVAPTPGPYGLPEGTQDGTGVIPPAPPDTSDQPVTPPAAPSAPAAPVKVLPDDMAQQLEALKVTDTTQPPPQGLDVNPPQPPISMPDDLPLAKSVVKPVVPPVSDLTTPITAAANDYQQQGRQLLRGAVASATAAPFDAGAAMSALSGLVNSGPVGHNPKAVAEQARQAQLARSNAEGLHNTAEQMREGAAFATGANPNPDTAGQLLAKAIGTHASPNLPISVGMTAADLLSQAITPAAAEPTIGKPEAEIIMTKPGDSANVAPMSVVRVTHTVPTAGGPAKVSDGDYKIMGLMGALTLGAIFAPSVINAIKQRPLPRFRPVENAPQGTLAISNPIDLARTYDDQHAGIMRVARRAGMDPQALDNVQATFRIQSGSAARNLVNSAITTGRMETPSFQFKSQVALSDLAKRDTPAVRDYLHARDTFDDILQAEATINNKGKNAIAQQAAIGPVEVRGMTKQDTLNVINAFEQSDPTLKAISAAYRDIVTAMRSFNSKGEYATISKKELTKLNQTSKNYVPWKTEDGQIERVLDNTQGTRVSPFTALSTEMQSSMRFRMENEAKGLYIDEMRKINPSFAEKITAEELRKNKNWGPNTVKIYRRGKPEYYVTDPFIADVLKLDPYSVGGSLSQTLYATKRLAESGATGVLAPWFSVTSALRSWQIGKITGGKAILGGPTAGANGGPPMMVNLKPPTLLGMTQAVPAQLYPQLAKEMSKRLESTSGGWITKVLGPQTSQALSTRLADAYNRSFYAQLEHAGTHQGSFLQHQAQLNTALQTAMRQAQGPARDFLNSYKSFLQAVHNSASFDFAKKNVGSVPLPRLAQEARHLTGDPTVGGQFFRANTDRAGRAIRLEDNRPSTQLLTKAVQGYGFATEIGRRTVPWWNITTQGMKRIGESYIENPASFVGKAYLYQALPAAALYSYVRGLGIDPNGVSYSDYMMNRRSEYAKLMNWYIPIPGKPAEQGMEVPRFHELAPVAHMMETALDHVARSDLGQGSEDFMRQALSIVGGKDFFPSDNAGAIFNPKEDLRALGKSFYSAAIEPPTPPLANAVLAMTGQVAPQGVFGGEAYTKKTDPYDQLGGMNATSELMLRALGTGMGDIIGAGYAAYTQTPEGFLKGVKNGFTEGGKRAIMKTPIARDLLDIKPPETGNTRITDELFKKEKVINNLSRYYRTWTKADGQINTKMASKFGQGVVENLLGGGPPTEPSGISQPAPTNPLYTAFMTEVYKKFNNDADRNSKGEDVGGIGFKSLWRRYGDYTENLKRLRSINDGNNVTWQRQLDERPDQLAYLLENHVDSSNLNAVKNFYERKRQETARQILFTIRAVEEDFSNRLGREFHIEDLDPYAKGPLAGATLEPQPQIPPWADGTGLP